MTFELGRALLLSDAVTAQELADALHVVATKSVSLPRALLSTRVIDPERLEQELAKAEAPVLRHVVPIPALVNNLPPGLCERLLALPVRRDPRTGTVDVAVVDARDHHAAEEIGYWLGTPVRAVRTSIAAMEAALKKLRPPRLSSAPIYVPAQVNELSSTTPLYGTPSVDPEAPPPGATPNIPIPLKRKATAVGPTTMRGAPAPPNTLRGIHQAEAEDAVVDLRRVKGPREDEPPGPTTARGPFAPSVPGLDPGEQIAEAQTRDEVVELLVSGTRGVAGRVAVFAVKKGDIVGWSCSPELAHREAFKGVSITAAGSALLTQALNGGTHLGRLGKTEGLLPLFAIMTPPREDVVALSVRVADRPALLLVACDLKDPLSAARRLEDLAHVSGEALARILRQKRL